MSISSIIGEMGNIGQANYAASKSGLFGLTKTRGDLARQRGNGHINHEQRRRMAFRALVNP